MGRIFLVAALLATTGAHWAVLQTVAWTGMLAENLQTASLHEALGKTLDGEHLCPICKAIREGKKSEQKKDFTAPTLKFEYPPVAVNQQLTAPAHFYLLPRNSEFAALISQEPPTPPPRGFFV